MTTPLATVLECKHPIFYDPSLGIGCYFDDEVHALLGISSQNFQSLYHFTVGAAVNDERLQTLAAYAHLQRA